VYELLGGSPNGNQSQAEGITAFADALNAFRHGDWGQAKRLFEQVAAMEHKGPAHFYLKLCEEYVQNPPGDAWNGVVVVEEK
jgi:hypothetical protein